MIKDIDFENFKINKKTKKIFAFSKSYVYIINIENDNLLLENILEFSNESNSLKYYEQEKYHKKINYNNISIFSTLNKEKDIICIYKESSLYLVDLETLETLEFINLDINTPSSSSDLIYTSDDNKYILLDMPQWDSFLYNIETKKTIHVPLDGFTKKVYFGKNNILYTCVENDWSYTIISEIKEDLVEDILTITPYVMRDFFYYEEKDTIIYVNRDSDKIDSKLHIAKLDLEAKNLKKISIIDIPFEYLKNLSTSNFSMINSLVVEDDFIFYIIDDFILVYDYNKVELVNVIKFDCLPNITQMEIFDGNIYISTFKDILSINKNELLEKRKIYTFKSLTGKDIIGMFLKFQK